MYIIDIPKFYNALKKKGYRSVRELAATVGVHRNTIQHYLSGNPVFPVSLEKVFSALNIEPGGILSKKGEPVSALLQQIEPIIAALQLHFPGVTFVLFGSRASMRAHKYSDWDIGVYSKDDIPHTLYRKIVRLCDDLVEGLPFMVDVINLNRADVAFLRDASKHWIFLGGCLKDWMDLQRKAAS